MLQNYSNMMIRGGGGGGGGGGAQSDHPGQEADSKDWKGPSWC